MDVAARMGCTSGSPLCPCSQGSHTGSCEPALQVPWVKGAVGAVAVSQSVVKLRERECCLALCLLPGAAIRAAVLPMEPGAEGLRGGTYEFGKMGRRPPCQSCSRGHRAAGPRG